MTTLDMLARRLPDGTRRGSGWRCRASVRPRSGSTPAASTTPGAFNVVVANCRFYGGGMQISPNSDPGDCLLDVLVMTGPRSDSFTILPRVYSGAHLPHRNIAELRAARPPPAARTRSARPGR